MTETDLATGQNSRAIRRHENCRGGTVKTTFSKRCSSAAGPRRATLWLADRSWAEPEKGAIDGALQALNSLFTSGAAATPANGPAQKTHMSWKVSFLRPVIHATAAGPKDLVLNRNEKKAAQEHANPVAKHAIDE